MTARPETEPPLPEISPERAEERLHLERIGQRVREARARKGMTRKGLAQDSGVSERYLAQLEAGDGNPSIGVLLSIARAMDLPVTEFLADPDPRHLDRRLIQDLLDRLSPEQLRRVPAILQQHLLPMPQASAKAGRVALIGLRGAGKSTLGRMLAERLGCGFVEINRLIEAEYGASIGELMALAGQRAYRRYERRALDQVLDQQDRVVIATGGGIVTNPSSYALLLERTHTVWLKAGAQDLMARVLAQGDFRPMARNAEAMADLEAILAAREPYYARADAVLETGGRPIAECLDLLQRIVEGLAPALLTARAAAPPHG